MSALLRCEACGGAVVFEVASEAAACMFCGSIALSAADLQQPESPSGQLPFAIAMDVAEAAFRRWASGSMWYPSDLRHARIRLHAMLLPAWRFRGRLETHWAGLERAPTRSGKRPLAGCDTADMQTMVPASAGLTTAELEALQPYDERPLTGWREPAQWPYEPPAVTHRAARRIAHASLTAQHLESIRAGRGLVRCNGRALVNDIDVELYMVPIYIGAVRHRDRLWRFVINGQSGRISGKAPIDRLKVTIAVVLLSLVAMAILWLASLSE